RVSVMRKTDDLSADICVLQLYTSIVLSAGSLCICQKCNQTLKTGTPHENNPLAEKPYSYGTNQSAG
ncbi:hypothetical protein ACFDWR_004838, partial [Salmonella enterica]